MRINHNLMAMNTHRQLGIGNSNSAKSMEKLSSGLRINRAGDDAAGLAISEKMRGQIRGLDQASSNAQDGISLVQTAEGALNETHDILQRMRELAVQAANDTATDADRTAIQEEMNQLTSEITRVGNNTEFNTKKVINGDMTGGGTGATGGQVTFEFNSVTDGDSYDITVGDDTWTVAVDLSDNSDDADSIDVSAKTISIDLDNTSGTVDNDFADALQAIFDDLANGTDNSGANGTNTVVDNLADFAFTDSTNTVTVKAANSGDFAGDRDVRAIISADNGASTGTINSINATDGTDGNGGSAKLQIGANNGQTFTISISDMRAKTNLKVSGDSAAAAGGVANAVYTTTALTDNSGSAEYALDISSSTKATAAIEVIDNAIEKVSQERSKLGSYQNRLEHTIKNLDTSSENLQAAESRIRDVDMAKEMMEYTKNNILSQAAQSMLAQANQAPQGVLQLLR